MRLDALFLTFRLMSKCRLVVLSFLFLARSFDSCILDGFHIKFSICGHGDKSSTGAVPFL